MELPHLKPVYEKYRDQGMEIVVIDRQRDTEKALGFINENELPYQFVEDGEDDKAVVRDVFGVRLFPTSYVIDQDGRIQYAHVGFEEGDEAQFEQQVRQVLELD